MPDSLLRNPRIFLLESASSTFSARGEKVAQRVGEAASGEVGGTAGRFPFTLDPDALGELGCQVQARPDRDDLRLELDGDDVEPSSRDVDAGRNLEEVPFDVFQRVDGGPHVLLDDLGDRVRRSSVQPAAAPNTHATCPPASSNGIWRASNGRGDRRTALRGAHRTVLVATMLG